MGTYLDFSIKEKEKSSEANEFIKTLGFNRRLSDLGVMPIVFTPEGKYQGEGNIKISGLLLNEEGKKEVFELYTKAFMMLNDDFEMEYSAASIDYMNGENLFDFYQLRNITKHGSLVSKMPENLSYRWSNTFRLSAELENTPFVVNIRETDELYGFDWDDVEENDPDYGEPMHEATIENRLDDFNDISEYYTTGRYVDINSVIKEISETVDWIKEANLSLKLVDNSDIVESIEFGSVQDDLFTGIRYAQDGEGGYKATYLHQGTEKGITLETKDEYDFLMNFGKGICLGYVTFNHSNNEGDWKTREDAVETIVLIDESQLENMTEKDGVYYHMDNVYDAFAKPLPLKDAEVEQKIDEIVSAIAKPKM